MDYRNSQAGKLLNEMPITHIAEILVRVDERTVAIQAEQVNLRTDIKTMGDGINEKMKDLEKRQKEKIEELEQSHEHMIETLERGYVKKPEFQPVKMIVYGIVGLVLTSVLGALVSLVISTSSPKYSGKENSSTEFSSKK